MGATAGFGMLFLVVFFIAQFVASIAVVTFGGIDPSSNLGDLTAIAITASAVICTGMILSTLAGRYSIRMYLALQPVSLKTIGGWLFATIVFVLLGDRFIEWYYPDTPPYPLIRVSNSGQVIDRDEDFKSGGVFKVVLIEFADGNGIPTRNLLYKNLRKLMSGV